MNSQLVIVLCFLAITATSTLGATISGRILTDKDTPLLGADKCTWGPSYWCGSQEAAIECNAMDYCHGHGMLLNSKKTLHFGREKGPLVGDNPCTWGPSYWCSSLKSANECRTLNYCQERGMLLDDSLSNLVPGKHEQLVGGNPCTWGPSYWCSSLKSANECSTLSYCQERGMLLASDDSLVYEGEEGIFNEKNPCASGPSFWCSSLRTAKECGAVVYCNQHGRFVDSL